MTPDEIRVKALELAFRREQFSQPADPIRNVLYTARKFEEYIAGPPQTRVSGVHPRARTVPVSATDTPAEHIEHGDELWGPMCRGCSHSKGVHKFGGCHFVEADMSYCECEGYLSVSGVSVTDTACTCTHPASTHDADGCKSATGCECTWSPA